VSPNFFENFILVIVLGSELPDDVGKTVLGVLKQRLEVCLPLESRFSGSFL
jgi:hypothetical protein